MTWSAPSTTGDSAITSYDVRHRPTTSDDSGTWTTVDPAWSTGDGDLAYTITGLADKTGYDVRVRAVNGDGDGDWSATVTGTTPIGGTWSYEVSVVPASIAAGSGVGATVVTRAIFQADEGDLASLSARVEQPPGIHLPQLGISSTGMNADYGWAYGLWSDREPPVFSDDTSFSSGPQLALAPGHLDPCTADLSAGRLVCEGTHFGKFLYAKSGAIRGDRTISVIVVPDEEATFTAVVNGLDSTAYTPVDADYPDATVTVYGIALQPDSPIVVPKSSTSLLVSWSPPRFSGVPITSYDLRHRQTDPYGRTDRTWTEVPNAWTTGGGDLEYTISGLESYTEYLVQVRADNAEGASAWSNMGISTTTAIGTWEYALELDPASIEPGGGAGVRVTFKATFRVNEQNVKSLAARVDPTGLAAPMVYLDSPGIDLIGEHPDFGWVDAAGGPYGEDTDIENTPRQMTPPTSADGDCATDEEVVHLVCKKTLPGWALYASEDELDPTKTIEAGVAAGFTYTAEVNGVDSTTSEARVRDLLATADLTFPLNVSGPASTDYAENGTDPVGTFSVSNAGDSAITWSLLGEDSGAFSISSSGVVSFNSSPDYEDPSDANGDNVYELSVHASTGSSTGSLPVEVTVTRLGGL